MSSWLQATLLGAVQGVTEFLPISSDGHLVLVQEWLGDDFFASEQALLFDVLLHVGTLIPVLFHYRQDLLRMARSPFAGPSPRAAGGLWPWVNSQTDRRLLLLVLAATVPTGIIGIAFEDLFERLFDSARAAALGLFITGAVLLGTKWAPPGASDASALTLPRALLIGFLQSFAIAPGISRSGTTIASGLFLGLDRVQSARFSFLLAVPTIAGAIVVKGRHALHVQDIDWSAVTLGCVVSLVVGYFALRLLVLIVRIGQIHRFTWYLWPVAAAAFVWLR
jgi:undecaprenyl-diphosphatase